jgi:hypothetical protein
MSSYIDGQLQNVLIGVNFFHDLGTKLAVRLITKLVARFVTGLL